jgi:hypothetical protein
MGIRERIVDAHLLWQKGRREGALLMILVAIAATSRKKFPDRRRVSDKKPFTSLVSAKMVELSGKVNWIPTLKWSIEFRGVQCPFEDFLYEFLRCELAHAATLPSDIVFRVPPIPVPIMTQGCDLIIHPGLVPALAEIVVDAPENDDEFPNPSEDFSDFSI